MMIEKIGAKNLKSSCRMMIEKVMIQIGVHFNRKGGGGPREELAMLRMQEANWESIRMRKAKAAKSQKAKKPKSKKAKKPPAAAELAMQRMRKQRNCECR